MRDVRQQLAPGIVGRLERLRAARELVAHLVERPRERRHLVAAALGRARRQVASAEADRGLLQLLHPPPGGTEHEHRDQRRADDQHRPADQRHRRRELADDHAERRPSQEHRHRSDRLAVHEHRGELAELERRRAAAEPVVIGPPGNEDASARGKLAARDLAPQRVAHHVRDERGMIGDLAAVAHQHDERLEDL